VSDKAADATPRREGNVMNIVWIVLVVLVVLALVYFLRGRSV